MASRSVHNRETAPEPGGAAVRGLKQTRPTALVLNAGSSSLKFALFELVSEPLRLFEGSVSRIGGDDSQLKILDGVSAVLTDKAGPCVNHPAALDWAMTELDGVANINAVDIIGHRVVHGGPDCDCPKPVTARLEAYLRKLIPLAPLHLPANIEGIVAARLRLPKATQIACFDTAFHQTAPAIARKTGLPREIESQEIRRYGYHGLSCEFIVDQINRTEGKDAASAAIIVAHLGAGASMTAIANGGSIDTTMGFSTLSGLPMATRCGDIDPGLVLYLIQAKGMSASDLQSLLYEQSGLLGLSGISGDVRDLLTSSDAHAHDAIDYFCFQARKRIGALAASMGRVNRIVLTGGIGAHAPTIRAQILRPLEALLPLRLDNARNESGGPLISKDESLIKLNAMPTDEELVIARHAAAFAADDQTASELS